jgi:hypothetical protein
MNKTQYISAVIQGLIDMGATPKQAFDAVLGDGRYDAMVSNLYDELRAKLGK